MRTTRRPRRRDQGFAIVLSAMLLLGVVLTAYVTYQATVVPVMEADVEVRHQRKVTDRFLELKSDLDRQTDNQSSVPALTAVPLSADRISVLWGDPTTGTLELEPGTRAVDLWSKKLVVHTVNKTNGLGHPETWNDVGSSSVDIADVASLVSFRLKLDALGRDHAGDAVAVKVVDKDGNAAGNLRICVARHPPDWDLHVRVIDASGALVHASGTSYFQQQSFAPYWIDLLDPEYRFDRVLATAAAPLEVTIKVHNDAGDVEKCPNEGGSGTGTDDLQASFAVTYYQRVGDELVLRGGGGTTHEDHHERYNGGALRFTTEGPALGRRSVLLENGGVVLDQEDGEVFRARPTFKAALVDNAVRLVMHFASLTGEAASVSGPGTVPVSSLPGAPKTFSGEASNLTLRVATDAPGLWAGLWRAELDALGLTEGTHYDVATASKSATLDVWGVLDPDPMSDEYDVLLKVVRVPVAVALDG